MGLSSLRAPPGPAIPLAAIDVDQGAHASERQKSCLSGPDLAEYSTLFARYRMEVARVMRSIMMFAAAAALVAAGGMVGTAGAQSQARAPAPGSMMGGQGSGGGMGSGDMMGSGGMGSGMMGRMMGGSGMMGGMGPSMTGQAMCSAMAGHIEGRLAYLKAELKITDAQESLWNAFAAAARENSKTMLGRCAAMMGQPGAPTAGLPDRLDQHEQFMAARLEAMRAMSKALKPLYAALDDSQKEDCGPALHGADGHDVIERRKTEYRAGSAA